MAEFQEVMKQAKRMCMLNAQAGCGGCPLNMEYGCKIMQGVLEYGGIDGERPEDVERIVMDWAAKNPEPRYPTWNAWLVSMGLADVYGGANTYRLEINSSGFEPIPADIAEKLGVKPIGGKEHDQGQAGSEDHG